MTKDQISVIYEQTLREAWDAGKAFDFYRLYQLIEEKAREEEREACALMCETEAANPSCLWEESGCWAHAAENCAGAIRARGNTV